MILSPIVSFARVLIQVARQIVRTVCEWVSSVITVIKTVVEKICSWLPWPLNKICDWVTKTIEVLETVWEWVCHDVLETIFEWVEIIVEYIIYVLKWVCWLIDWPLRFIELILCKLDVEPRKFMGVCVKILADAAGNPVLPVPTVQGMMQDAAAIFRRCGITMVVCSIEIVVKPEYVSGTTCDAAGMFKRFFTWFASHACGCCSTATVYFVQDIVDASGCAYPGSDWVTVAASGGDGTVVVQEIGHLADLWTHSSDPNNVMTDQPGGTHDQITENQCCMIRASRFVRFLPPCDLVSLGRSLLHQRIEQLEKLPGEPFNRKPRGPRHPGGSTPEEQHHH